MTHTRVLARLAALTFLAGSAAVLSPRVFAANSNEWRDDWEVERGFTLTIEKTGFDLPTAIAFVPDPGKSPNDPLYFVTELRGAVKIVTNDGSVRTFARVQTVRRPLQEAPQTPGQVGLGGICLDPAHGYVFVTFAYEDSDGLIRNNIARFTTRGGEFGLRPIDRIEFGSIFAPFVSSAAHQIGGCQVVDGALFVSVGDGWDPIAAQRKDVLLGKILRLTLDGEPAPGNPFERRRSRDAASYVWAYGLRNPFGLKAVGDALFVTHNGVEIDSFLRIERARNYLWDGTDWSVGTGAEAVISPSLSPVQLDHYPTSSAIFPRRYRDSFFFAVAGHGPPFRTSSGRPAGVVALPYDLFHARVRSTPRYVVRYRGRGQQLVAALAFGPDGLYFAPLLPNAAGVTPVIRASFEPRANYPHVIGATGQSSLEVLSLMSDEGCFSCHDRDGRGGGEAPSLSYYALRSRVYQRLASREYLKALSSQSGAGEKERAAIVAAKGTLDERMRLWVRTKIQSPRFDNPSAQMPDLGLTGDQAGTIAAFLVGNRQSGSEERGVRGKALHVFRRFFGEPSPIKAAFVGLVAGAIIALGAVVAALCVRWALRSRVRRPRDEPA